MANDSENWVEDISIMIWNLGSGKEPGECLRLADERQDAIRYIVESTTRVTTSPLFLCCQEIKNNHALICNLLELDPATISNKEDANTYYWKVSSGQVEYIETDGEKEKGLWQEACQESEQRETTSNSQDKTGQAGDQAEATKPGTSQSVPESGNTDDRFLTRLGACVFQPKLESRTSKVLIISWHGPQNTIKNETPKPTEKSGPQNTIQNETPKPTEKSGPQHTIKNETPKPMEKSGPQPNTIKNETPKPTEKSGTQNTMKKETPKPTVKSGPQNTIKNETPTPTKKSGPQNTIKNETPKPTEKSGPQNTIKNETPKPTEKSGPQNTIKNETPKPTEKSENTKTTGSRKGGEMPSVEKQRVFGNLLQFAELLRDRHGCQLAIIGGDFNLPQEKAQDRIQALSIKAHLYSDYKPPKDKSSAHILDFMVVLPKDGVEFEVAETSVHHQYYKREKPRIFDHPIVRFRLTVSPNLSSKQPTPAMKEEATTAKEE